MPVWDRLRGVQKDDGAPTPSRQKLEAWQNAHSSSFIGRGKGGIQGGNSYYQYTVSGGPAPKRSPKDYRDNNQLSPPAQPAQAGSRNSYLNSDYGRPASSVYSQPSPVAATYAAQQLRNDVVYSDPNEISPPSSPEALNPSRNRPNPQYAGDVSPIDEIPDMSQLTMGRLDPPNPKQEPRTNIPMLRRERRRKNSDAAVSALRQQKSSDQLNKEPRPYGHDVRWDPDTGEPTTSEKGRPSQIDPREFTQTLGTRSTSVSPRHVKQAQQNPSAIGERVRRMRGPSESPQPEPAPAPAARPEWRGASGRTTLAAPLQDSYQVAPLKIPPKSDKRLDPTSRGSTPTASANTVGSRSISSPLGRSPRIELSSGGGTASNAMRAANQTPAAGQQSKSPTSARTEAYPNSHVSSDPFFATAKHADPPRPPQSTSKSQPEPPTQPSSLQVPSNAKATKRKSIGGAAIGHGPHPSGSSSVYSQPDVQPPPPAPPSVAVDEWVQPPSRFSTTTYGTSNPTDPYRASTDDENAPPLPRPPPISTSPLRPSSAASGNSVMERGRPIVAGYEKSPRLSPSDPVKISLGVTYHTDPPPGHKGNKPTTAHSSNKKGYGSLSIRPVSPGGGGRGGGGEKDLPLAPPETASVSAGDRVAQLNARLQALGNRRINLHTAIRQMTELMPTDSVLASDAVARKREAEKRKVEALRHELADVERQSYDVGLSLHRAYKRLDRDAEYEPTTLWVRRVTG